jgi:DNA-binding NarL/FixJ family response regulator
MKEIKIVIVDDHGLMREGLVSMFNSVGNFKVVGSVSNGEEAINIYNEKKPDVVLMDIMLPGMTGIEASKWIIDQDPEAKILLLSMEANIDLIEKGISVGVLGYILKTSESDDLAEAVSTVFRGEKYFSEDVQKLIFDKFYSKSIKSTKDISAIKDNPLSNRETEILKCICTGISNREIGDKLFISKKTVDAHVYNIQSKLHLKSKIELLNYARKNNLLEEED